jgi:hypothetical protein
MVALRILETLTLRTALGIQFWDPVLERPITDGLRVQGQRLTDTLPRARVGKAYFARPTTSGVYAFFGLHPDEMTSAPALAPVRAVIDVNDPLGRFLPASFEVIIPVDQPFRGSGSWLPRPLMLPLPPANQSLGVFLWSAPTRSVPPGLTVVYASLGVGGAADPLPAAYAVVRLLNGSAVHAIGMTDAAGRLTLPMAYPSITHLAPQPPLRVQQFNLTVEVLYQPAAQTRLPGSQVPNLAALLGQTQQRIGSRRNPATGGTTYILRLPVQFAFEEPVILRTPSSDPAIRDSFLRIRP